MPGDLPHPLRVCSAHTVDRATTAQRVIGRGSPNGSGPGVCNVGNEPPRLDDRGRRPPVLELKARIDAIAIGGDELDDLTGGRHGEELRLLDTQACRG